MSNLYKIGKTKNIKTRLSNIKGSINFIKIEVVILIEGDEEAVLHSQFAPQRKDGEWFVLSEYDIGNIKSTYQSKLIDKDNILRRKNPTTDKMLYVSPKLFEIQSKMSKNAIKVLGFICSNMRGNSIKLSPSLVSREIGYKNIPPVINAIHELIEMNVIHKMDKMIYGINRDYICY